MIDELVMDGQVLVQIEKAHSALNHKLMGLAKYMDVFDAELIEKKISLEFMLLTHKLSGEEANALDDFASIVSRQKTAMRQLVDTFVARMVGLMAKRAATMEEASKVFKAEPGSDNVLKKVNSDLTEIRKTLVSVENKLTTNSTSTTTTTTTTAAQTTDPPAQIDEAESNPESLTG